MLTWIKRTLTTWGRIVPNHGLPILVPQPVPVPVRVHPRR
jgi:hypothetical protein